MREGRILYKVKAFLKLSRVPFLMPGLAPFTAGVLLGAWLGGNVNPGLIILGYLGITLIMLATYYSNEYFDYEGDVLNRNYNKFSGGSRALSDGMLPRSTGLHALVSSLGMFAILFLVYALKYYHLRPALAWMSLAGLVAGVFYSAPPFKWAYRGIGELLIGFCYGWLAVVSGYYIVRGTIDVEATLLSLPAAFTVFSVILINEVPDYDADIVVSKKNLVVRLGREKARTLYTVSNLGAVITASLAAWWLGGFWAGLTALVMTGMLALKLSLAAFNDRIYYDFKGGLEKVCALTIMLNAAAPFIVLASAYLTVLAV
jgi:1,4-dihydroxy-2-naphthoate octaprenyltransferase